MANDPSTPTRRRRRWPWVVLALVLLVAAGSVYAAVSALGTARRVEASASAAQAHLTEAKTALTEGDTATARAKVAAAQADVTAAEAETNTPVLKVAAALPVVSTPVHDVHHLIAAADDTVAASDALVTAYAETIGKPGALISNGTVDLASLSALAAPVAEASQRLDSAAAELNAVQANLPGTTRLATARDAALGEIAPLQETFHSLAAAVPAIPDALGQNGPKRYLLAVLNPAEMRSSGGAPLSVALLTFDKGHLAVSERGQTSTEITPGNSTIRWQHVAGPPFAEGDSVSRFANANAHPDFRVAGEDLMRAWEATGKPPVDGVIAIDTSAIVAALRATGPVQAAGFGTVTADTFIDQWIDSYRRFESNGERQSINDALAAALIERVASGDSALSVVRAMASTAPGRHLQIAMRPEALQHVVQVAHLDGAISDPTGDHSAWFSANTNASKTDVFSNRVLTIDAVLGSDGSATVTQTMTITNAVPEWFGNGEKVGYLTSWNAGRWAVYVPKAAVDEKLAIPVGWRKVSPWNDGLGQRFLMSSGWLDRNQTATLTLTYRLPAGTFAPGTYQLTIDPQPVLRPVTVSTTVTLPDGSRREALAPTPLDHVIEVSVPSAP